MSGDCGTVGAAGTLVSQAVKASIRESELQGLAVDEIGDAVHGLCSHDSLLDKAVMLGKEWQDEYDSTSSTTYNTPFLRS